MNNIHRPPHPFNVPPHAPSNQNWNFVTGQGGMRNAAFSHPNTLPPAVTAAQHPGMTTTRDVPIPGIGFGGPQARHAAHPEGGRGPMTTQDLPAPAPGYTTPPVTSPGFLSSSVGGGSQGSSRTGVGQPSPMPNQNWNFVPGQGGMRNIHPHAQNPFNSIGNGQPNSFFTGVNVPQFAPRPQFQRTLATPVGLSGCCSSCDSGGSCSGAQLPQGGPGMLGQATASSTTATTSWGTILVVGALSLAAGAGIAYAVEKHSRRRYR